MGGGGVFVILRTFLFSKTQLARPPFRWTVSSGWAAVARSIPCQRNPTTKPMKTSRFPAIGGASLAAPLLIALSSGAYAQQYTWDPDDDQISNGGPGLWDPATTANWDDDGVAPNVVWDNTGATEAIFGDFGAQYTVEIADGGVTVGDLTVEAGTGRVLLKSVTDNLGLITIAPGGATWNTGGREIEFHNVQTFDTPLSITSGDTLTIAGGGQFDAGERANGANWVAAGATLDVIGATTVRGNAINIAQFGTVKLADGSTFIQERNADQTIIPGSNTWEITGDVTFGNKFNRKSYMTGVISGTGRLTYKDGASQNTGFMRIDNAANTFSGGLTVDAENNATMVFLNNANDGVLGAVPGSFDADNIILKNGGTLRSNQNLTTDSNRGITLENGGILNVSNNKTFTLGGAIAGDGGLQIGYVAGQAGLLDLSGANASYTGQTQIFEGNVRLSATNALGQGVLNLGGTEGFARLILNDQSQTIGGLYNTGSQTKQIVNRNSTGNVSTTGTLTFDVANGETYSAGSATGVSAADDRGNFNIIKNGLGSQALANLQIGGDVTVNEGTLQIGANNGTSAVTGAATVTGGTLFAAEELVGVTSIDVTGGSYRCSTDGGLGTVPGAPIADFITLDGGILDANLNAAYGGNFEIDSNRGITLGAGGGTIWATTPAGSYAVTYDGVITGVGSLVKDKAQTLILGGANDYTGATTVAAGSLRLAGSLTSDVTVQSAAVFVAGDAVTGTGSGSLPSLTLEAGARLNSYINTTSEDAGAAVVSGAVTLDATSILTVIDQGGDMVLAGGTELILIDYTGGSLTGAFDGLAEGATVVVGSNNFTLSYTGGSGSMVTLTAEASSAYDAWVAANYPGLVGGFDDDDDLDGLSNGQEWYFGGTDPLTGGDGSPLVGIEATGAGTFEFSHLRPVDTNGATATYEWSSTLAGAWNASGDSDGGFTVTLTPGPATPDADPAYEEVTVTVTAAPTSLEKVFARVNLTMP